MSLKIRAFSLGILLLLFISECLAAPVQISTCAGYSCIISIPRYKMFMSQNNPNHLWIGFLNSRSNDFKKSLDGGLTWNATEPDALSLEIHDMHASVSGDSADNVYISDPGWAYGTVWFRKIRAPGQTPSDVMPAINLTSPYIPSNVVTRTNILAQDPSNIWIFYRTSNNAIGNLRYFRSTDGGATFPEENWVEQTNYPDFRIGSLLIDGKPAVYVHYQGYPSQQEQIDYRYFIWNGSSFVRNVDADIVRGESTGAGNRDFNMNYANGYMHLVYNKGAVLRHAYKRYGDGQANWQYADVETLANPPNPIEWQPSLSRHGNDMYLIYVRSESSAYGNSNVYLRKWNTGTLSWGAPVAITTDGGCNRIPQSSQQIAGSATYLPIIWTHSAAGSCSPNLTSAIMADRYMITGGGDQSAPAAPRNLSIQ